MLIVIPGTPPSPNRTRAGHWRRRYKSDQQWRSDARLLAIDARNRLRGVTFPWPRVALRYVWVVPDDRRRRDPDNWVAACKPILDGIVDAGIIPGDDSRVIVRFGPHGFARGPRAVEVHVEPV